MCPRVTYHIPTRIINLVGNKTPKGTNTVGFPIYFSEALCKGGCCEKVLVMENTTETASVLRLINTDDEEAMNQEFEAISQEEYVMVKINREIYNQLVMMIGSVQFN